MDLTLLHSERSKLYGVLATLSAIELTRTKTFSRPFLHRFNNLCDFLFASMNDILEWTNFFFREATNEMGGNSFWNKSPPLKVF